MNAKQARKMAQGCSYADQVKDRLNDEISNAASKGDRYYVKAFTGVHMIGDEELNKLIRLLEKDGFNVSYTMNSLPRQIVIRW